MTLREYAEKRAGVLSYLGGNALFHALARLYIRHPKLLERKLLGAPGRAYRDISLDVVTGAFRNGLRGKEFREIPLGLMGSAAPSLAVEAQVAHEFGKTLKSQGVTEESLLKMPKRLRQAALLSRVVVPSAAAALGAGAGALVPSASHKANELGLPTPPQKETHRKRNALVGAVLGAGAGFGGGALGLHNYLGPLNLLRPIAERVTGTKHTAESAAQVLHDVMNRRPGSAGQYLTKKIFRRPRS
ncbi:MAG: hypothetical protein ABFE07_28065 [Armatimonadia bacterium]